MQYCPNSASLYNKSMHMIGMDRHHKHLKKKTAEQDNVYYHNAQISSAFQQKSNRIASLRLNPFINPLINWCEN